jgi:cytochrome oxidase assembly protein ShyY1
MTYHHLQYAITWFGLAGAGGDRVCGGAAVRAEAAVTSLETMEKRHFELRISVARPCMLA